MALRRPAVRIIRFATARLGDPEFDQQLYTSSAGW
jgi:hypothetical protein